MRMREDEVQWDVAVHTFTRTQGRGPREAQRQNQQHREFRHQPRPSWAIIPYWPDETRPGEHPLSHGSDLVDDRRCRTGGTGGLGRAVLRRLAAPRPTEPKARRARKLECVVLWCWLGDPRCRAAVTAEFLRGPSLFGTYGSAPFAATGRATARVARLTALAAAVWPARAGAARSRVVVRTDGPAAHGI